MLVRMLTDQAVAFDGIHVTQLSDGQEVDLPDDFAVRYVREGRAEALEPLPDLEPEASPDGSETPPAAKPLAEMGLRELLERAETLGVEAPKLSRLRLPGTSKAAVREAIEAHLAGGAQS